MYRMSRGLILGDSSYQASQTMLEQGLLLPERPEYEIPQLPDDISSLSDELLMRGYTLLVAWTDYAATQAACAAIDERAAVKAADLAELRVLGNGAPKGTVSVAKARAASDETVVTLRDAAEVAHHYRKLVETIRDNLDRNYALYSRELTRRTSTNPQNRKDRFTT